MSRPRPLARRAAVLAIAALVAPLLPAPASAQTAAPAITLRDVREFACPPGQVQRPGVAPRFTDTATSTFTLEIDCLAGFEVTLGTGDGTRYDPLGTVTRAQMAQFLARVAQKAGLALDTRDAGFRDLGGLPPAARDAINAIANLGVARGRTATLFAPLSPVRRDQMASFIDRLQDRVAPSFSATQDYFGDDSGGAEASINRLAANGIVQGVAAGTYEPARSVTRQQMAGFLTRYLDIQVQRGKVTPAFVRNNEVLPVAPAESAALAVDGSRAYSATNLATGVQYRVLLVDSRTLRRATSAPPVLTFSDANGDRLADAGTYAARISQINGATVAPPAAGQPSSAVSTPTSGGVITFTVTGGGRADDDVVPVVFRSTGRPAGLELAADLRPVEAFGVGGRTTFVPAPAPAGTAACVNGCLVTAVDRTASTATVDTGTDGRGDIVLAYAAGADSFFLRSGGSSTAIPANEFASRLTRGDTLAANPYKGPSGASTFTLTDTSAQAPTVTATAGSGASAGTATISVQSATPVVTYDRFVIERAAVTPAETCATGQGMVGTFAQIADLPAAADSDTAAAGFQFVDRPGSGCFRYRAAGVVDGQQSALGTSGNVAVTAPAAVDTARPVSTNARVDRDAPTTDNADGGDRLQLVFNETMTAPPADAFIQVRRTNGALQVLRNQADALFSLSGGTTINIDLAPGVNVGPYPLTVVDAGRITDVAGNTWSVGTSPDRVIDK
jgi:hypothetical protein